MNNSVTSQPKYRITALADSDSYLKFACSTLHTLGDEWDRRVLLVRSPIQPTPEQVSSATAGTFLDGMHIRGIPAGRLRAELEGDDVVLAASTGPVAQEIFAAAAQIKRRPALISALPGVAIPATEKSLRFRALGDAYLTHSHAECREFSDIAEGLGLGMDVLLTRLPFLRSKTFPVPDPRPLDKVVFAPQAKVPVEREQRVQILRSLANLANHRPELSVQVKLRAGAGGPQTHLEQHPFDYLWADLMTAGEVRGDELSFSTGSMAQSLRPAAALVTVSSTSALEAIDVGLPTLILADFGVSDEMLNAVFTGSGLFGTLDDLESGRFFHPEHAWLRDNYFHPEHTHLAELLAIFAKRSRAGKLSDTRQRMAAVRRRRMRGRVRTLLPTPALNLVRTLRAYGLRRQPRRAPATRHG